MKGPLPSAFKRRALLAGVVPPGREEPPGDPLGELEQLARTARARVVGRLIQRRERPDPATYLGSGKVGELRDIVEQTGANLVLMNNDLSPSQVRNLEERTGTLVMDRSDLILDIFATHARTREAKLQVELVQLQMILPRLVGRRKSLEQFQAAGAVGAGLAGGLAAGRGPGEKQIEYDRRVLRRRIHELQEAIRKIQKRRERLVRRRTEENFTVSLVGYTNAGKSTLMRRLTGAAVGIEDELFHTLDTKTSTWELESGLKVLLSDTVGFIENLPPALLTAFYATLEEVREANVLLHVADATSPRLDRHLEAVERILGRLGCGKTPTLLVLNKIDRIREPVGRTVLMARHPRALLISAAQGTGLKALEAGLEELISDRVIDARLKIPVTEGRTVAEVLREYAVRRREVDTDHVVIDARIPRRDFYRFERYAT